MTMGLARVAAQLDTTEREDFQEAARILVTSSARAEMVVCVPTDSRADSTRHQ